MAVRLCAAFLLLISSHVAFGFQAAAAVESGEFEFVPGPHESDLPKHFQLAQQKFAFELTAQPTSAQAYSIAALTFPSPVKTPHVNNNTVHCEYFKPLAEGKHPAVIVLHILGGDFQLSRLFCRSLAQRGTAALFLKMPYYGPRRQPDVPARMVSTDPDETIRGMTQAILDIRCGASWLSSQPEVDGNRLGIMGISLGGITSALAATAEPRFSRVCLLLAGGDISQVAWESKELEKLRSKWVAGGGTKESLAQLIKVVDPVTYAKKVPGREVLMLNASHDEVIPKVCTESLWKAFGEPEIYWWDAGHYSALRFIFDGLARTCRFFDGENWKS
jgi:dienelactone hydrolase